MKANGLVIAIFFLGLCTAFSGWSITDGLKEQANVKPQQEVVEKQLLSEDEVADYLGLSIGEVRRLTKIESGPNSYTHILPFIEIDTITYYPKKALDEWLASVKVEYVY